MKHFANIFLLIVLLVATNSCGTSRQMYADSVYNQIYLSLTDNETHNYLPFEHESHSVFHQAVIKAYIENGTLYFHIQQSHPGKLIAHYKHITSKTDSTITFSGYKTNSYVNYNCSITDKALKRLSEDCFALELNGTNIGNAKGFRQFCRNVYELYHPIHADRVSRIKTRIDELNSETDQLYITKTELSNRLDDMKNAVTMFNTEYNHEYNITCKQVKDSVKTYWLNSFFKKYSKKRFAFVSGVIDNVEYTLGSPNSAGGCDFYFSATNKSSKTVKYAYITIRFKNAVDDYVFCTIRDYGRFTAKLTGPVPSGNSIGGGSVWENVIYNYSADKAIVTGVTIEYMDKSKVILTGTDIDMMFDFNALCDLIIDKQKIEVSKVKNRNKFQQMNTELYRLELERDTTVDKLFDVTTTIQQNKAKIKELREELKKLSKFSTV